MKPHPHLSDIQPTRAKFEPGARLLVRMLGDVTADQHKRIVRAVTKYAGTDVRVGVVNVARCRIGLTTLSGKHTSIAGLEHAQGGIREPGMAGVNCCAFKFADGDRLDVMYLHHLGYEDGKRSTHYWQQWAGDGVEVVVVGVE